MATLAPGLGILPAMARVVVPRLPDSTAAIDPASGPQTVDPPTVVAIRLAFGVGKADSAPTSQSFKVTYHLSIPVFSLGGLDPDGVYEFDAAALLDTITSRAQRRRWGVRLELELEQSPQSVSQADVVVEAPFDDALGLSVLGQSGRGKPLPGGGRSLVIASGLVTSAADVAGLSGGYSIALDSGEQGPAIESAIREVRIDSTRFEFEPG